jgi:hypothetical protein
MLRYRLTRSSLFYFAHLLVSPIHLLRFVLSREEEGQPRRRRGRSGWPRRSWRRRGQDLIREGDGAASRDVASGGEVETLRPYLILEFLGSLEYWMKPHTFT